MKKTMRRPLLFGYRNCDAFAEYLREKSRRGWHFREFRLGMVFEKGVPEERVYRVEVFPGGHERDRKPDEGTAQYVQTVGGAGWKLVDGIRKFRVLEQLREDAVPPVTEEERLAQVWAAEKDVRLRSIPAEGVLFALLLLWVILEGASVWMFSNAFLGAMACLLAYVLVRGTEGMLLVRWYKTQKKNLSSGQRLSFQGKGYLRGAGAVLLAAIVILGILGLGQSGTGAVRAWVYGVIVILWFLCYHGISWCRLERTKEWGVQLCADCILAVIFVVAACNMQPASPPERAESILGTSLYKMMDFGEEGRWMEFRLYKTRYRWGNVLIWRKEPRPDLADAQWQDSMEDWGALEARKLDFGVSVRYRVRYETSVVELWTNQEVSPEEISEIRQRIA